MKHKKTWKNSYAPALRSVSEFLVLLVVEEALQDAVLKVLFCADRWHCCPAKGSPIAWSRLLYYIQLFTHEHTLTPIACCRYQVSNYQLHTLEKVMRNWEFSEVREQRTPVKQSLCPLTVFGFTPFAFPFALWLLFGQVKQFWGGVKSTKDNQRPYGR